MLLRSISYFLILNLYIPSNTSVAEELIQGGINISDSAYRMVGSLVSQDNNSSEQSICNAIAIDSYHILTVTGCVFNRPLYIDSGKVRENIIFYNARGKRYDVLTDSAQKIDMNWCFLDVVQRGCDSLSILTLATPVSDYAPLLSLQYDNAVNLFHIYPNNFAGNSYSVDPIEQLKQEGIIGNSVINNDPIAFPATTFYLGQPYPNSYQKAVFTFKKYEGFQRLVLDSTTYLAGSFGTHLGFYASPKYWGNLLAWEPKMRGGALLTYIIDDGYYTSGIIVSDYLVLYIDHKIANAIQNAF